MSERAYPVRYSAVGMTTDAFRVKVKQIAVDLPRFMSHVGAETVVVMGTSGLSVAFALRMITDNIPMLFVRKRGDLAHSAPECAIGDMPVVCRNYVFLDDFMESGDTIRNARAMLPEANLRGLFFYARGYGRMSIEISAEFGVPRAQARYDEGAVWSPLPELPALNYHAQQYLVEEARAVALSS